MGVVSEMSYYTPKGIARRFHITVAQAKRLFEIAAEVASTGVADYAGALECLLWAIEPRLPIAKFVRAARGCELARLQEQLVVMSPFRRWVSWRMRRRVRLLEKVLNKWG
jgi:hypothetical protein